MKIVADLHIHSKYSRAVSRDMTPELLDAWADDKGITVMGTGDFTHPLWLKELKQKLEPAEPGLYALKKQFKQRTLKGTMPMATRFMLTVEISCIYSRAGRTRRVHHLIFAPDFATVEKINTALGRIGNLKSDGRPIIGIDSEDLLKIVLEASDKAALVPAHCLLPDTLVHTKDNLLKPIQHIQKGDVVITHRNRWRKVTEILQRPYHEKVYHIKPRYFSLGLIATAEHPFYAIKTHKNCHWSNGICKPLHSNVKDCTHKHFKDYKAEWLTADKLEKGDVLIYPRCREIFTNHKVLDMKEIVGQSDLETRTNAGLVTPVGSRVTAIKQRISIDKNFCRLAGYYLAEGYTNSRDLIGFAFNVKEMNYIDEVIVLMREVFGFDKEPKLRRKEAGVEILFYSKILCEAFQNLFYNSKELHNASTKALPIWALGLPDELQVEIFRYWWRGDTGYTTSRVLLNQMKIILLRLGIAPSISVHTKEDHNDTEHMFGNRLIRARHDLFSINRLTFFEDKFGLLETKEFSRFYPATKNKYGWMDDDYLYMPIYDIKTDNYEGNVYNLEVEEDNSYTCEFATVHNCWTPWFAAFGSMSGFDSLEECFGDYAKHIFAVETGLSSDPPMNWRLSALDRVALISNSDSHSLQRIGREANIFDTELSYEGIMEAIKSGIPSRHNELPGRHSDRAHNALCAREESPESKIDPSADGYRPQDDTRRKFLGTIEFFPEEGRYHYDGHRLCGIMWTPEETKKHEGLCPKCGQKVTVGVLNRVAAIADRKEGYRDARRPPYWSVVPLDEVIGEALEVGPKSKAVQREYQKLIIAFGSELAVSLDVSIPKLATVALPEVAEGIERMRKGHVSITPGYDGEYGVIKIFNAKDRKRHEQQEKLF